MTERVKGMRGATKYDKVVRREVCQVVNKGTQVFGQQVEIVNDYQPNYMMAIVHKVGLKTSFILSVLDTDNNAYLFLEHIRNA